ncbi:unnamed protein product, partial [Phaeothamnion confervicola]
MFGIEEAPDALAGMTAAVMLAKVVRTYADSGAAAARIRAVINAGEPVRDEEILLADGRICLRDFVPIEFDGRPHGRLWYHRDVTEQQRSREALRESEARFRVLAEDAPVMIWLTAADGRYEFVNRAM